MDEEIEAFLTRYIDYWNGRISAFHAELDNAKNEYHTCQKCHDKQQELLECL